jgi:hypothetical protein
MSCTRSPTAKGAPSRCAALTGGRAAAATSAARVAFASSRRIIARRSFAFVTCHRDRRVRLNEYASHAPEPFDNALDVAKQPFKFAVFVRPRILGGLINLTPHRSLLRAHAIERAH